MEWIIANWGLVLVIVATIVGLVKFLISKDKASAKEWLLYAVFKAEKEFGSKTGVIKLRHVYNWFLSLYPFLAKFLSFEEFSDMVDEALVEMKDKINKNSKLFEYVGGYEELKK